MSGEQQVPDALESIRDADSIDHDARLRHVPIRVGGAVGAAALGIPAGLHSPGMHVGDFLTSEYILSYGAYVPVVVGGALLANNGAQRIRTRGSERRQDAIREACGEPVDVIRVKQKGEKESHLLMRWYGLESDSLTDAIAVSPAEAIRRSRQLIAFAREHDIYAIALDSRLFKDQVDQLGYGHWDALTFLTDIKQLRYGEIEDHASGNYVVACDLNEFEAMLNMYKHDQAVQLTHGIVAMLKQPHIAALYQRFEETGNTVAQKQLLTTVRRSIEAQAGDSEYVPQRHEDGSAYMQKIHTTASVMGGGRAMHMATGHDTISGLETIGFAGVSELSKIAGHPTNEALITKLSSGELQDMSKKELLVGLYLLLQDEQSDRRVMAPSLMAGGPSQAGVEPYFRRLKAGDTSARHGEKRGMERMFDKLMLQAVLIVGGIAVGASMQTLQEAAYQHEDDAFSQYAATHDLGQMRETTGAQHDKTDAYKEYVDHENSLRLRLERFYDERMNNFYDSDDALSTMVANFLIDDLGIDATKTIDPLHDDRQDVELRHKIAKDTPPNLSVADEQRLGFGDVSSESNKVVFSVTPLRDESSAGYWFGDLYDTLTLTDGAKPITGLGVEMESSLYETQAIHYLTDANKIAAVDPDFMIETPYIGLSESQLDINKITLPVQQGMRIVGAQIIDKNDPTKVYHPIINVDGFGMYSTDYDISGGTSGVGQSPIVTADMQEPVLQYWVKRDTAAASAQLPKLKEYHLDDRRDQRNVVYSDKYWDTLDGAHHIAVAVRQELGLPKNAPASRVLDAIKHGKQYSYEPLAYDHASADLSRVDGVTALTELGTLLADLRTANCNVATLTAILGTLDKQPYYAASGFHDNGDGLLTQQESHAWMVDQKDTIVDPTPDVLAPGVKARTAIDQTKTANKDSLVSADELERGATALLGGLLLVVAWRQRRRIEAAGDKARTSLSFGGPAMQYSVAQMQHEHYSAPTTTYVVKKPEPQSTIQVAQSYVRNVPAGGVVTTKDLSRGERLRRGFIRLNDKAIRRYVVRTKTSA